IGVQPEVLYGQKHASFDQGKLQGTTTTFTSNLSIDVVEVPVLLKIAFAPMQTSGLHVVVGPAFSYIAKAKQTDQAFGTQTFPDTDLKDRDQVKTTDVTVIGGVGYTTGHIDVEGRVDFGFRNLNKQGTNPDDFSVKPLTIAVLVHYYVK